MYSTHLCHSVTFLNHNMTINDCVLSIVNLRIVCCQYTAEREYTVGQFLQLMPHPCFASLDFGKSPILSTKSPSLL